MDIAIITCTIMINITQRNTICVIIYRRYSKTCIYSRNDCTRINSISMI